MDNKSVNTDISTLEKNRIYLIYRKNISINILTKISMRLKLFKIHKKNFKKNDKINKNTHIKVIFFKYN